MKPKTHRITFPGTHGHELAARLETPGGTPRAFAIFAHCFTCTKDSLAATRISRALAEQDIAVLRFDFTGLGSSEGDFANTNFSSNVGDLVAAATYLRQHHQAPLLLVGHSLGGAAVLMAASQIPEAKAVCTIGAPCSPDHVQHLFDGHIETIHQEGESTVTLAGRQFCIQRQFLQDIADQTMQETIGAMRKALLVCHAPLDNTVGIDNASRIFQAARHPKSFLSLDGANHLLTRREDASYVATVIAAWATRFLPSQPTLDLPKLEHGEVLVRENGTGKFAQDVLTEHHHTLADEPLKVGGDNTGPNPYEYLLASLGACTSMTLRMYAERKALPVENISVRLRHQKVHAKDCEECESTGGYVDIIDREIEIVGDLSPKVRARMLEIADRCPVPRSLHSETLVKTKALPPTKTKGN